MHILEAVVDLLCPQLFCIVQGKGWQLFCGFVVAASASALPLALDWMPNLLELVMLKELCY